MAVLSIKSFGGIAPSTPPRYLQDNQAQTAINCPVFQGSIQPLSDVGASVATLTKTVVPLSLYRWGQDTVSDNNYWFHWSADVDVCRSQIAGDASEWTFFTGDNYPKATYNTLALSGSDFPTKSNHLGLPAPDTACVASANTFVPVAHAAELFLNATQIGQLTVANGLQISTTTDADASYTTVALSGTISPSSVITAVNSALSSTVTASSPAGSPTEVSIKTTATGTTAKLFVRFQTGTSTDTNGTFTLAAAPNLSATGAANTDFLLVIDDAEISSLTSENKVRLVSGPVEAMAPVSWDGSTPNATNLAAFLNSNSRTTNFPAFGNVILNTILDIQVKGSCIVITPKPHPGGVLGKIQQLEYQRTIIFQFAGPPTVIVQNQNAHTASGSPDASPATQIVTQTDVDALEGNYLKLTINGTDAFSTTPVPDPSTVSALRRTAFRNTAATNFNSSFDVELHGILDPIAVIRTTATGTSATLAIRAGTYPTVNQFSKQQGEGYVDQDATLETRLYTYTYVNKEAGFEFESAPALSSNTVDVRDTQTVSISGLGTAPPEGYNATHKRLYRAVSGVFLFLGEIIVEEPSFFDNIEPEKLGEQLPSLNWSPPPQTLQGLTNLPNGIMAGFVGRDIYFCDPYHPHAWPENYIQTVDYPVVGFGVMDTTLAVLTKGHPYLIQGSHPDSMTVVKADLYQACASKRSIVNVMGSVVYASPDGLMMLSTGGSKIITQNLFNFTQWQDHFNPTSIHAYQQDNQYIAFYDNGTTQGGFVFDMPSGQFILHDIYATAAYQDVQRDKLFLTFADRTVKPWGYGAAKSYTWRSKKFTMPQIMGFSCAQLEAEVYPMTLKVYVDTVLIHTQSVTSRDPFRLPSKVGRDWEMQIEGSNEVFSLAVANSMSELASG